MARLIRDLLEYSRITTHGREMSVVDLDKVMTAVRQNLMVAIGERDARIDAAPLPCIQGDESQMERLLQNLIGNAIKFVPPDRTPEVHVGAEREGNSWRLSVTDNGIGIDADQFERIFGVFQRLHGRQEYEGTGIGLAVCKRIAERHGGRVDVRSAPGEGSTFTVTLPAIPDE